MRELNGRVAVVTGAASGIGLGLATRFAAEGMKVALADVERAPLEKVERELRATGADVIAVPTDVSQVADVEALASRTLEAFGEVNILCNNAGVETGARFEEITLDAWRWVIDVNLLGVIIGCRTFLPLIRRSGEGHIVNTGSPASFATDAPTFHPYITTKFGVLALSESLRAELADTPEIGVSLLVPGAVRTNMMNAERNRPEGVPSTEGDPARRPVFGMLNELTDELGIQPSAVAEAVVDAIRADRFYILTHPDLVLEPMRARLRELESAAELS